MMRIPKSRFLVDLVAFICFVFLTSTGVIMAFLLPPGSGKHSTIWNMDRHQWGDIHFWLAVVFLTILAFHLFMHWKWIWVVWKGRAEGGHRNRILLGFVGLLAIITLSVAPIITSVETTGKRAGDNHKDNETVQVFGSMTLAEVSGINGVPVDYLLDALDLPAETDPNQKMAQIRQQHGISMQEVRNIINQYRKE